MDRVHYDAGQGGSVTFDSREPGTPRELWRGDERFGSVAPLELGGADRIVVVAAHPDDESLGAGGLLARASSSGLTVQVVVVTDGAASHPDSDVSPHHIARTRVTEVTAAVAAVAPDAEVKLLGFADGLTLENRDRIAEELSRYIAVGSANFVLVAPWRGDGHRDHRVIGEVCAQIAEGAGARLLEYPIWMWHWASPSDPAVPWPDLVALKLTVSEAMAKGRAIDAHESQTRPIGTEDGDAALLRPDFVEHFRGDREFFVMAGAASDAQSDNAVPVGASLPVEYFDDLYARHDDPWRFTERWYEKRKRAITLAALPAERYESVLEIGCSIGVLTEQLADRAGSLLAIDLSAAAVERARQRTAHLPNVTIEVRDVTAGLPIDEYDLIVVSEVGYYLDTAALEVLLRSVTSRLTASGTVLLCHWRHPVSDYPLSGDVVHEAASRLLGLPRLAHHLEDDFVIDVYSIDGRSVAELEGLS